MKRLLTVAGVGALALLLSSCFTLQGFSIKTGALKPGAKTKLSMTLRPTSTTPSKTYQFVLVGINTPGDLRAGKATWGTNGTFGGPKPMVVQPNLYTSIGTDCDTTGLTLSALGGTFTWKGYTTQNRVSDKGLVKKKAVTQIVLKATSSATVTDSVQVIGATGIWTDVTSNGVSADDIFSCTGNGAGAITII
jgi:hypothetical protein